MASHSYKLTYYDMEGRAEVSRLLFAYAGQSYEDYRLSHEEYDTMKSSLNLPFGQIPTFEIDGEVYAQSFAIASYLAREFGLYGKTNLDGLKIDQVTHHILDIWTLIAKDFYEKDATRKAQVKKENKEVKVPKAFEYLENILAKNTTGWFVGTEMTLADIAVFDMAYMVDSFKYMKVTNLPPRLKALMDKVQGHPRLVEYLANRKPLTQFDE